MKDSAEDCDHNDNINKPLDAVQNAMTTILQHNFDAVSKSCLQTVLKLLDNILQNPYTAKFRTVKLTNATVQAKIVNCRGGVELLQACGFDPPPVNCNEKSSSSELQQQQQQQLVLPEHSLAQQEWLVQVRHRLAQCGVHELQMTSDELPPYRSPPPPVQLVATSTAASSAAAAVPSNHSFNPFQGQRFDALSASVGVNLGPDVAYTSKTERELERLQQKQRRLEAKLHHSNNNTNNNNTNNTTMERNWIVALPGQPLPLSSTTTAFRTPAAAAATDSASTASDGALLAQRAQRLLAQQRERDHGGFTTHAMRQVARLQTAKVYAHAILQIICPDGTRCCGTFAPTETIRDVQMALQHDCFVRPSSDGMDLELEFDLYVAPPRRKLNPANRLQDEGLVPAAKLFVSWTSRAPSGPVESWLQPHRWQTPHDRAAVVVAFPQGHSLIADDNDTNNNNEMSRVDNGNNDNNKKKKNSNREEDLLKRMMGGVTGKTSKGSSKPSDDGTPAAKKKSSSDSGKPKWFKG